MSTALLITPHRHTDRRRIDRTASTSHSSRAASVAATNLVVARVVSATSLSAHAEVRGMARPQVPNYALRRFLVGTAAAVTLLVGMLGVIGAATGFTGSPASAAPAAQQGADVSPALHVAEPGDTLWSIANTYRGDVDRDRFIDALIRLNGGVEIQAGQAVWLP